jgi:hypothetical protein
MTTEPRIVRFDWDDFRRDVERLRVVHATRSPHEAVAASLEAFSRWGVKPPASFVKQHPAAVAAWSRETHAAEGNDE